MEGKFEKYERVDFIEKYGVIPYSIWDTSDAKYSNPILKKLKEGRGKSTREGTLKSFGGAGERTKYTATASYFNPKLCRMVYSSYCSRGGWIFDPFASVTRPYMAKILDYNYIGCEVRSDECEKINGIIRSELPSENVKVNVLNIDCREFSSDIKFDLVFSCPPYWNLETYSDLKGDMSNIDDYGSFIFQMGAVFQKCASVMKKDSFCCFVVGDFRDYSQGRKLIERLVPFTSDMIICGEKNGLFLYDKVVLKKPIGTAPSRLKLWNNRKTVRIHEELLVFKKTDAASQ